MEKPNKQVLAHEKEFKESIAPYIEMREQLKSYEEEQAELQEELSVLSRKKLSFSDNKQKREIEDYLPRLQQAINDLKEKIKVDSLNTMEVNKAYRNLQNDLFNADNDFTYLRDEYRKAFIMLSDLSIQYQKEIDRLNREAYSKAKELGLEEAMSVTSRSIFATCQVTNSMALSKSAFNEIREHAREAKEYLGS